MKKAYFSNSENGSITTSLFSQDCISGMKQHIQDSSVSVVVTSPPYNIGIKYSQYTDNLSNVNYIKWIRKVGKQIDRILEPGGALFLNIGGTLCNPWIPMEIATSLRDYFVLQNVIHWVKSMAISKSDVGKNTNLTSDIAIGHYKPITSKRFLNDCHEYIFHFTKYGNKEIDRLAIGVPYQDKTNIKRWKSNKTDKRCRGNVWFIPYETIQNGYRQRPHPASFPTKLPEMCIKLHGVEETKLVVDPFVGIGSTAIACKRLGIPFIGFDIDKAYLDIASYRIISSK